YDRLEWIPEPDLFAQWQPILHSYNNIMTASFPSAISGQKYISLVTFRKTGVAVPTPVRFGEKGRKMYVMSRYDSRKYKRIPNNPRVLVAHCTSRRKVTGRI